MSEPVEAPSQAEGERDGEVHHDLHQTTPSQAEGERDENDEQESGAGLPTE